MLLDVSMPFVVVICNMHHRAHVVVIVFFVLVISDQCCVPTSTCSSHIETVADPNSEPETAHAPTVIVTLSLKLFRLSVQLCDA